MTTEQTDPLESLARDEREALAELARARVDGRISRRGLLTLAAGGVVGLGAGAAGTEAASADASTSDSDGNVGTPSDRADVFADGVETNTVEGASQVNEIDLGTSDRITLKSNDGLDNLIEVITIGSAADAYDIRVETGNINANGENLTNVNTAAYKSIDVRNVSSPSQGQVGYHDGSGTNTEGPAFYNGSNWVSTVDGSTIS